jgi:uncharacterized protein (TIGR02246 family)
MRNRSFVWLIAALAAALVVVPFLPRGASVEAQKPAEDRAADREALRQTLAEFARTFEKGDAKTVAAFWTEEGEYEDEDGEVTRGREALARAYQDYFKRNKAVKVEAKITSIRFLGRDTALEEGTFSVKAAAGEPIISRYTALQVREKGRWLIARMREWPPDDAVSLKDLAWLIGTWRSTAGDRTVEVRYAWDDNKKFIHARFTVKEKGKTVASGLQIIGQDPADGGIRSWVFEGEGGIGEGAWTREGDTWTVESTGTLSDGTRTTSVNVLCRLGADEFTWQSQKRTAGGEAGPDTAPVKVKRVKE